MGCVNCYDVVSVVVEEASERFSPLWKLNKEKESILKEYCSAIDILSDEFEGESYDVEVDEITMEITIGLECGEITIKTPDHELYELITRSVSCSFTTSEDDNLLVKFVFPSVWDRA